MKELDLVPPILRALALTSPPPVACCRGVLVRHALRDPGFPLASRVRPCPSRSWLKVVRDPGEGGIEASRNPRIVDYSLEPLEPSGLRFAMSCDELFDFPGLRNVSFSG